MRCIIGRFREIRRWHIPRLASRLLAVAAALALSGLALRPALAQSVEITVVEAIGVSDASEATPPAGIVSLESIAVADLAAVVLPVTIEVAEIVAVADLAEALPPAVVDVAEPIGVTDSVQLSAFDPDLDDDGVEDATEDAAPNGGDGNGDGVPDATQAHVASLPDASGTSYVTLAVSGACSSVLTGAALPESAVPDDPAYDYPFGLLDFSLPCTSATVTVLFHGATSLAGPYRNYGPTTPGDTGTTAWYTLPTASFGTTTVGGATVAAVTLALSDGVLGDETGADGEIVSLGGPAEEIAAVPLLAPAARIALVVALLLATGGASLLVLAFRSADPETRRSR